MVPPPASPALRRERGARTDLASAGASRPRDPVSREVATRTRGHNLRVGSPERRPRASHRRDPWSIRAMSLIARVVELTSVRTW
jgi:hypothetical protein